MSESKAMLQAQVGLLLDRLAQADAVMDAIVAANSFEEPASTGLVLMDGTTAPRENPEVVVSITVNGKGIRTLTVVSKESVASAGWANVLAEVCMGPLGLLAREMEKGGRG